ncbi:hypothetical protein GOBAR_AA16206 [Gossypium barbadense]|uniref:RNase H type-1 domain-containing protein n=1 Tax=Gossypium barbadense TaxID=3634 RepID=A0A2P5XM90_GOSBA|nr:hypothetical protein GOBAR_AA16206 [Gossypium barbadense]
MGSRLKVNFDATFNNHNKESCSRLVIRNSKVEALKLGLQLGLRAIEVEGNSRTIIRKLQEEKEDRSKISVYIKDAQEANRVAHCLAQEGLKKRESTYLTNLISPGAVEAIAEDRRQMEVVVKQSEKMQNEEGQNMDLYIPRKCSATNRLITSKDHASVQINVGHLDELGRYTGTFSTFALCGFVRAQESKPGCL